MARSTQILALGGALLLTASAAHAQSQDWFLLLVGNAGAISENSGTTTTGLTDTTEILSYGQNFFLPLDAQGTPGPLEFRPLRVLKAVDGSSPRIAEALATGEGITTCNLTLYEYGIGAPTPLYEIQLIGARIIGVSGGGDAALAMSGSPGNEAVSIVFQSLKLTDVGSGQTTTIP